MNHQRVAPTAITMIAADHNKKRRIARKLAPGRKGETVSLEERPWWCNRLRCRVVVMGAMLNGHAACQRLRSFLLLQCKKGKKGQKGANPTTYVRFAVDRGTCARRAQWFLCGDGVFACRGTFVAGAAACAEGRCASEGG